MKLSNQPPKGTADWMPDEFRVRKYIFDTWRDVCTRFGYQEYLTPVIESADIYRAKSGEDLGGKELMVMTDRAGRELAIRPEMTPSVTRMVSRVYESAPKPLRYFSIANFLRNEKPQRGRNREFWQLNFDIFGAESINSDFEILQIAIEILLQLGAPKDSFKVKINNRKLLEYVLSEIGIAGEMKKGVVRTLDKWGKLSIDDFKSSLETLGLTSSQIELLIQFMSSTKESDLINIFKEIDKSEGYLELQSVLEILDGLGYSEWVQFSPSVIRGLDYYDGLIFEVFDQNPENSRSMFGGGRYNGLAEIFGSQSFPAVGCAPGDETTKIFLESWGLVDKIKSEKPKVTFLPILTEDLNQTALILAQKLRSEGRIVETSSEVMQLGKALKSADKKGYAEIIILGSDEVDKGIYKVKNLEAGTEESFPL